MALFCKICPASRHHRASCDSESFPSRPLPSSPSWQLLLTILVLGCFLVDGCKQAAGPTAAQSPAAPAPPEATANNGSQPSVADELFDFHKHPRKTMIKPIDTSTLTDTEKKYGRAPQRDSSVEYQPNIVLMEQGDKAIRSQGTDGLTWTFDANAPHVSEFEKGKIIFATGRAVGKIVYLKRDANEVKVMLAPIQLTDVIRNGDFGMSQDINPANALVYINPDLPQPGIENTKPKNTSMLESPWKGWNKTVVVSAVSDKGKWIPIKRLKVDQEGNASNFTRIGNRWSLSENEPVRATGFGSPRLVRAGWSGQLQMPGVPGPRINMPKIPSLSVPSTITITAADLTGHPFCTSSNIGVKYIYDKNDLHYEATGSLTLKNLHTNFALGIANGTPQDSGLDLGGTLGVLVHLNAHTSASFHVNSQTKIYLPVDFSIPLGGPVPFALTFEQAAIINTGFSAKNSIMNAEGNYSFTGGLKAGRFNGQWGVSVPLKVSSTSDVGATLEGLSVGINSLVLGTSLEAIVGLGVAGFTTGVYVTLTVSSTVLRAPDIALACRHGSIEATIFSGLGYAMPKWVADAVNYVLSFFTDDRVEQEGSIIKGPKTQLFHGTTTVPTGCTN